MGAPADKQAADLEKRISVTDAVLAQVEQRAVTGALAEYNAEQKRQGITATSWWRAGAEQRVREARHDGHDRRGEDHPPDDYRAEQFIGLFHNSMVMRSLGARVLTGLRGDTVIPKQTGASSAYWIAEGDALTESNPTFDNIKLQPKHVGALASISRQLLQQANPSIEGLLRDDFVNVIGLAVDKAMLHGAAANDQPVGILNVTGIQTASLATLSWAAVMAMLEKLGLENVTANHIVTHHKAATKLGSTLKAASSGSDYLLQDGRMAGLPVSVTNQLDAKTGTPDKGRVLVGDFSQLIVGEWGSAEILANPYAAGYYEAGAVQLRILATMDMVCRNPKAFVLADDLGL
ncbi:phage major capsid protein [Thauera humireducens]|uniref:phage major capsid protein n=1 Tax=Thauera humireducens TaxID=1134435 RepID=UPI00311F5687